MMAATSQMLKCSKCNIVINELLAFVCDRLDIMDEESVSRICVSAYTEEEMSNAKSMLFDSVPESERERMVNRRGVGRKSRDIDDIISLIKQAEPEILPVFVARDLKKLPPVLWDHVDVTTLLKEMLWMRNEIKRVKEQYATIDQLESVKSVLDKSTFINTNNSYVNNKRGGCVLNSPQSIKSITSDNYMSPERPLLLSPRTEGGQEKSTCGSRTETYAEAASSAMTRRKQVALERPAERGHTDASSVAHIGKQSAILSRANTAIEQPPKSNDGWTLVQRNKRFKGNKGKAIVNSEEKFKAADIKLPIYIYNVDKGVSEEDIIMYIKDKSNLQVTVEKMNMKKAKEYNSYKVFVPRTSEDLFLNNEFWPDGISYRRFIYFKKNNKASGQTQNTYNNNG